MKVALVYDRVNKWGGAERVLLALHKIFPDAPLFTSVYAQETAQWAKVFDIKTSFLQNYSFAQRHHELLAPIMPIVFEGFSFEGFDLVISVTSEAAKGIITRHPTKHICICLTPTRYLWSGYNEYFTDPLVKIVSLPVLLYLRQWDAIASSRPDAYIAISKEVQKRIKTYYKKDAEVIYLPLMVEGLLKERIKKGEYFLVVSRLSRFTGYKRVDIAIEAANKLKLPLLIVGDGDRRLFAQKAGKTVKFLGHVSEKELAKIYASCKALLFPGKEDFGLVMVEAQASGKPVIAFRAGGALEIVREGKTGEFFNKQTPASLINVLKTFNERQYNTKTCRENAKRFSFFAFENALKSFIEKTL